MDQTAQNSSSKISASIRAGFTTPVNDSPVADDLDLLNEAIDQVEQESQSSQSGQLSQFVPQPSQVGQPSQPTQPAQPAALDLNAQSTTLVQQPVVPSQPTAYQQAQPQNTPPPLAPTPPPQVGQGVIPQILPDAVLRATDTLNPPVAAGSKKEAFEPAASVDLAGQEDGGKGIQYVETEPAPEISPEVEAYLERVNQDQDQSPQEIVVADGSINQPNNHQRPSKPVVVLPITPEIEKEGEKKSSIFSIRWLVEWSRKIMKMFVGQVIYRQ